MRFPTRSSLSNGTTPTLLMRTAVGAYSPPTGTGPTANCSGVWSVPEASIAVAGTQMLQPTRSSIPGGPIGPRYSVVDVTSGATLYLQPGVYYFEGSAASSGLNIHSGGTVATGECYG